MDISGECSICGTTCDVDEEDGICGECYAEHRYSSYFSDGDGDESDDDDEGDES